MKNVDWMDIWHGLLMLLTVGVVGLLVFILFQDHVVRYYFVSDHGAGQSRNGFCIDGWREWTTNQYGVFCSDDIQKTLSVLKQMNESVVGARAARPQ